MKREGKGLKDQVGLYKLQRRYAPCTKKSRQEFVSTSGWTAMIRLPYKREGSKKKQKPIRLTKTR